VIQKTTFAMEYEVIDLKAIKKCPESFMLAVNDTINVLTGKWKLPIMAALIFGKKRFTELQREIPRITPRMLSKELRELELNGMITRTVYDSVPVIVEYEFTASGKAFKKVLDAMVEWGLDHRKSVLKPKG
jgi:DNA-binding HxlR family transcriptional regulator